PPPAFVPGSGVRRGLAGTVEGAAILETFEVVLEGARDARLQPYAFKLRPGGALAFADHCLQLIRRQVRKCPRQFRERLARIESDIAGVALLQHLIDTVGKVGGAESAGGAQMTRGDTERVAA